MAYFVQSYSTDPAKDWDEENRELISVMFEFSPRSVVVNPRIDLVQVPVRIVVNGIPCGNYHKRSFCSDGD